MNAPLKYLKTPDDIKSQMETWFRLSSGPEQYTEGTENFTLFDLVPLEEKNQILHQINLRKQELPVFLLRNNAGGKVITTTERFLMVEGDSLEELEFAEFKGHKGFERLPPSVPIEIRRNVKKDGGDANFGLMKKNGETVIWPIPTGTPGFRFWNVTKKCEFIARKYEIDKSPEVKQT